MWQPAPGRGVREWVPTDDGPQFVTFSPMVLWTGQKILVHAAYCVGLAVGVAPAPGSAGGLARPRPGRAPEDTRRPSSGRGHPTPGRRERSRVRVTERAPEQAILFDQMGLAAYNAAHVGTTDTRPESLALLGFPASPPANCDGTPSLPRALAGAPARPRSGGPARSTIPYRAHPPSV